MRASRGGFISDDIRLVLVSFTSVILLMGLMLWAARAMNQVAERLGAEQALLIVQLREAESKARAASDAKSQFFSSMSHEIRTPLNGVLGMAQAMSAGPLDRQQRERLQILQDSGAGLLTILNDVLDLAKVEAGQVRLEHIEFGLATLLTNTYATFIGIAAEKDLTLDLDVEDARGVYSGDPHRLRQVVANLISNALKFTRSGEVRLTARSRPDGVTIEVSDTGPGISADVIPHLFSRYVQADASITRTHGGTGLGLAICRELITLMAGEISLSTNAAGGATFTLELPLQRLRLNEPAPIQPAAPVDAGVSGESPLRVLVAEDNATNRLVIQTLLSQVGLDVSLVADGREAVEAWAASAWDLVLMDIQMPVMDGLSAVAEIRRLEASGSKPRTPIIALTANVMPEQVAEYRAAGMDGHVAKPIDLRALVAVMDSVLAAESSNALLTSAA